VGERPARRRSHPCGPTAAVRSGPGRPDPSRGQPAGARSPAFTDDGPGDPSAGRGEADRRGRRRDADQRADLVLSLFLSPRDPHRSNDRRPGAR
jgi:hypothetical protein